MKLKDRFRKKEISIQRTRELSLIIITFFIVILYFTGFSIGKSITTAQINADGLIAKPIINVDREKSTDILTIDDKGVYEFKVKNYDGEDNITDVVLEYSIEIVSNLEDSIILKLYQGESEIKLENNKTKKIKLTNKNKQEHKYKLEVLCDQTKVNSLEDIFQEVQIKIHCEQAKV